MPYHQLMTVRRSAIASISKEIGCSALKMRYLFGTCCSCLLLVLVYYVASADWIHHLLVRHQQFQPNAETWARSSKTVDTLTETSNIDAVYNWTCGSAAAARGAHQKIIGFSIFGDFSQMTIVRKYLLPLKETVRMIPAIYPDWIVRIYHNLTRDDHDDSVWTMFLRTFELAGHVDLCNVTQITTNRKMNNDIDATTWRWLPLFDDMVDTFMSRDSDSLIVVPREQDAVRQWLASDAIFHTMKDHPAHCIFPMLAGMWGVKLSDDRQRIVSAFESIFAMNHRTSHYGYDQFLLAKYVWPIAKTSVMAHDSYCCQNSNLSRPFPSRRGENRLFIGGRGRLEEGLKLPCPEACRPANVSQKWTFC